MQQLCKRCFSLIKEGQIVAFLGTASYHVLKSKIAYALDRKDMEVDPESLVHNNPKECEYSD